MKYTFRPSVLMTLATILVMALCIKAGLWQYNKAQTKLALQTQLNARLKHPAEALTDVLIKGQGLVEQDLRYRRVKFTGVYDTRFQVLLDNQVENTVAGYHVLTPMQVQGSKLYVLVNRGWIAGLPDQVGVSRKLPTIETPKGQQIIEGDIALPAAKFFSLEPVATTAQKWQPLWQHLDMQRYAKSAPFGVQKFIVRLDATSKAGGFVRNWPPPGNNVNMHLGYAYQWFGFALTLLVIYIVLNLKKKY
ncbi:MAG: SURF1 family protein [Bdellovibrio sp.]|nr:SURF1 family protein [Methylotenera sp.]